MDQQHPETIGSLWKNYINQKGDGAVDPNLHNEPKGNSGREGIDLESPRGLKRDSHQKSNLKSWSCGGTRNPKDKTSAQPQEPRPTCLLAVSEAISHCRRQKVIPPPRMIPFCNSLSAPISNSVTSSSTTDIPHIFRSFQCQQYFMCYRTFFSDSRPVRE